MPTPAQDDAQWWVNDSTPENPYGKSEDYEGFLNYLGALRRSLTPELAQGELRINLTELNDHPDYKAAAIAALEAWEATTGLKFTVVDDAPYNEDTDYMEVVSPEIGEPSDGSAFSSDRYVSVGQRFHDTEADTGPGGYIFDTFVHEFGHEWGLNHPGLYNYSGPGGVQINYLNNATWTYDRQQYSVMSYFDGIDVGEDTRWSATTPLIADIEAVQRRYFSTVDEETGERTYQNVELNTGDDVYGFASDNQSYKLTQTGLSRDIGFVIHDTGGLDTIDFSGSIEGTVLDLRAGKFSSVNGHSNNVAIYAGHNADGSDYYIEKGIGSRYADVIIGNDGDNIIDGRGGADSLSGGLGNDTYYVDSADDVVRELADGGNDTIIVLDDTIDVSGFENVENIVYADGSGGPQTPAPEIDEEETGDTSANPIVYGEAAADTIDGGAGGQTIFGLDGDDLIIGGRDSLASRDINNTIAIADLEDQTESDDGDDALYGGRGNDTIRGGQGNDVLDGGSGNDLLQGQDGVDVFRGGAGIDTVDYSNESPFQLIVNLERNEANGGTATGDTYYSIENLIGSNDRIDRFVGTGDANHFWGQGGGDYFSGRGGNDILDGGADGDILEGDDGNDTLIGGSEADALHGGDGIDTAVYSGSDEGVTINLVTGTGFGGHADGPAQIVGQGAVPSHDLLFDIENLVGSRYDDHLIGDDKDNSLAGGSGNDVLEGGLGRDTLNGGAGSDTVDFGTAKQGVVVTLGSSTAGGDTLLSIENLAGSGHKDALVGDSGANVVTGQGGRDWLKGGAGDDTLLGDFDNRAAPVPQVGRGSGYTTLPQSATNNSIAAAYDITNNFSLTEDPDIRDSTSVLHTTVNATGNGQGGYYKIELAAGTTIRIDIDRIANAEVHDSWLRLIDSSGNVIADNDDGGGDPGSNSPRDSSIVFTIEETGTYYINEGSWVPTSDDFTDAVPEGSTYEVNVSVTPPPSAPRPGTSGADSLFGGDGNDLIDGGLQRDVLYGNAGEDTFRFSTALRADNVDVIRDFTVGEDQFQLETRVFTALDIGELGFDAFTASSAGTAQDAEDRIIYDSDDGWLLYDADGNGSGAAIRFAQVGSGLNLSASDFIVA